MNKISLPQFCLYLFMFFLLAGCEDSNQGSENPGDDQSKDELITIKGKVSNSQGPVSNAIVSIDESYNWTTKTSEDGRFEIQNVSKGEHDLFIKMEYESSFAERQIKITALSDLVLDNLELPLPLEISHLKTEQTIYKQYVYLIWNKSDADDFREYKLYRHTSSGMDENTGELIHVSTFRSDTIFVDSVDHKSRFFYRLYQVNDYGRLGGSNIVEVATPGYQNNPELSVGQINERYVNPGEDLWLNFQAEKGNLYKITSHDPDWESDYYSDPPFTCYRKDKSTLYFESEPFLPHTATPKTIIAEDELVYLKFKSNTEAGFKFKFLIEHIPYSEAKEVNNDITFDIDFGETKVVSYDADENVNYKVDLISEKSDKIYVKATAYKGQSNETYFYEVFTGNQTAYETIHSTSQGKIYFVFTGSYWFAPTTVLLRISEIES